MMRSLRVLALGAAAATMIAGSLVEQGWAGPVYEGKGVTIIVPNSPAGLMTQYAQMLAPHLEKQLGADYVRVENHQGAGGLKGTNRLWSSDPDGMTIAFTNVPTLIVAQLAESPGVQFDATKFTYLGRATADPRLVTVGAKSSIKTVDDIKKLGRPFIYASQGTDEDFYSMVVLAKTLGYELKIVTGYEGDADTSLAVIKGDADGHMTGWTASKNAIAAGEKRPVVFVTSGKRAEAPDVPSAVDLIDDPEKKKSIVAIATILEMGRGFFAPPDTDPAATEEMRAAIEAVLNDPEVVKEAEGRGLPIVFAAGAEQQQSVEKIVAASQALTPVLKEALASIK